MSDSTGNAPSRVEDLRRGLEIIHNLGGVGRPDPDWPLAIAWAVDQTNDGTANERRNLVLKAIAILLGVEPGEALTIPEMIRRRTLPERLLPILDEDRYEFTGLRLREMLFEVAGTASGVFLREDPDKVMPLSEVAKAVQGWAIVRAEMFAAAHQDLADG